MLTLDPSELYTLATRGHSLEAIRTLTHSGLPVTFNRKLRDNPAAMDAIKSGWADAPRMIKEKEVSCFYCGDKFVSKDPRRFKLCAACGNRRATPIEDRPFI